MLFNIHIIMLQICGRSLYYVEGRDATLSSLILLISSFAPHLPYPCKSFPILRQVTHVR